MAAFTFTNNVVIITGATAGIGKALALSLARQGARLALAARNVERLQEVANECELLGGKAVPVPTDVSDPEQSVTLIDKTVAEYHRIDTLIVNAGISMWARFDEIRDLSLVRTIMDVNYFGSVYPTFYALPYLKESKGRLVAISSLTGKNGAPTRSAYSASKHAQAGFFDSLRIELKRDQVSVTVIYPGFVATEVRKRAFGANGQPLQQSHIDESRIMSADVCAEKILKAAAKRRRQVVMTGKAKMGQWVKLISPDLVDRLAEKMIESGK